MTKLTDTQRIILSAASQRTDRLALPLPKSLRGGAVIKVIKPLLEKGLLEEVDAIQRVCIADHLIRLRTVLRASRSGSLFCENLPL
jgi:hypothetical protein